MNDYKESQGAVNKVGKSHDLTGSSTNPIGVDNLIDISTDWLKEANNCICKAKEAAQAYYDMSKIVDAKSLTSFGNYLLSEERNNSIVNEVNKDKVTDADFANWKAKQS